MTVRAEREGVAGVAQCRRLRGGESVCVDPVAPVGEAGDRFQRNSRIIRMAIRTEGLLRKVYGMTLGDGEFKCL